MITFVCSNGVWCVWCATCTRIANEKFWTITAWCYNWWYKLSVLQSCDNTIRFANEVKFEAHELWSVTRKWYELTGEWRKLHIEVLNDLYTSPNIVPVIKPRRMRWAEHVARMEKRCCVYRVLEGKREGKNPLGRSWLRWEDNIKTDLHEVGCSGTDWIDIA